MRNFRIILPVFLLFWAVLSSYSFAGYIVTPEWRSWAQKVLAQEKELAGIMAPNTVGVLYFENLTSDPQLRPLGKGLALMLITDLSKVKRLQVVERVKLQALLEELKLSSSGLLAMNTAPRLGRLLGAHWLVGGAFRGSREALEFQSHLFEVPKVRISASLKEKGKLEAIFEIEKKILFTIIDTLQIELTPKEREELRKPLTTNLKALIWLSRGLEASDEGNYQEAAQYFQKSLQEDPDFILARHCFQELIQSGLIRIRRTLALLRGLRAWTSLSDRLIAEYPNFRLKHPLVTIPIVESEIKGIYIEYGGGAYKEYYTPQNFPTYIYDKLYETFQELLTDVIQNGKVSSIDLDYYRLDYYYIYTYPVKNIKYRYDPSTGVYQYISP